MDLTALNPLEALRCLVSAFGLAIDILGWFDARRREQALWANQAQRIGRGHIMARSNVQTALLLIGCHATLLFIAAQAIATPDGPLSQLGIISNVGQAIVGMMLTAVSVLLQNAQHDADILDRRNGEISDFREALFDRIEALFERYTGRVIRQKKEG